MMALVKRSETDTELALVDVEPGDVPPGHVRIAVSACGVCGTDLHIADGSYSSRPPVTLGHEVSGVVGELGAGVPDAWAGAAVACETFYSTCRACQWCRTGRPNLCPQRRSIGSGADGGFTGTMVVPAANLHRLPSGLTTPYGALCEPLACVCQSLLDPARVQPGDQVLVTGPGPMGLLAAQVARFMGGVVTVAGTPRDTLRLDAAVHFGFRTALAADIAPAPAYDVVVESSGAGQAMALGLETLRSGGAYVQIGQTDKPASVRLALASFKELRISGGFASTPRSWARALKLLELGAVDLQSLVTEIAPLAQWRRVFDSIAQAQGLKFLLSPGTAA